MDDFLKKNKTAVQIVFPTNAPKKVQLVPDATIKSIFYGGANAWDQFYRRFPGTGGLITISRVGVDSKGTVAIIYLGHQFRRLAGAGFIRVLRREGGKWVLKIEGIGPVWMS